MSAKKKPPIDRGFVAKLLQRRLEAWIREQPLRMADEPIDEDELGKIIRNTLVDAGRLPASRDFVVRNVSLSVETGVEVDLDMGMPRQISHEIVLWTIEGVEVQRGDP